MDKPTLSLNFFRKKGFFIKNFKGQMIAEALLVFLFLISFLSFVQYFYIKAKSGIQQHRLSSQPIKKQSPWFKKEVQSESFF